MRKFHLLAAAAANLIYTSSAEPYEQHPQIWTRVRTTSGILLAQVVDYIPPTATAQCSGPQLTSTNPISSETPSSTTNDGTGTSNTNTAYATFGTMTDSSDVSTTSADDTRTYTDEPIDSTAPSISASSEDPMTSTTEPYTSNTESLTSSIESGDSAISTGTSSGITSSFSTITATSSSSYSSSGLITSSTIATTSSSASSSSSSSSSSPSSTPSPTPFVRGINLGNWLILEKWMDDDNMFKGDFAGAHDHWSYDSISGAEAKLRAHWDTYVTEADLAAIASYGFNAVRIPIGYWAYNNTGTPYISGADHYLERAIGWARTYGLKVLIDCHANPGSQNGYDHSGHSGAVLWQQGDNMEVSTIILETMATKYGSMAYADVVNGLELTNEPISWGNNTLSRTKIWARDTYLRVKAKAENPNFNVIMHDGFMSTSANWLSLPSQVGSTASRTYQMDTHLYQVFDTKYKIMDGPTHIQAACNWSTNLRTTNAVLPIFVAEWSAAINICVSQDGMRTTNGSSCAATLGSGCQCTSTKFVNWNDKLRSWVARYVEAQLDTFEANAAGYYHFAWRAPGMWSFRNLVAAGMFPLNGTRNYPPQCS